jgi:LacI family transcriptional regulator
MGKRKSVALIIESSNAYGRELLRGISSYISERNSWSVTLTENEPGYEQLAWFKHWRGDGVIARVVNRQIARRLASVCVPVVDVSGGYRLSHVSQVLPDDAQIAHLASDHLRERGFSYVGYYGDERFRWSRERCRYFRRYAREAGLECFQESSPARPYASWSQANRRLREWLRSLPLPIGIMASHDLRGQQLLDACKSEEIAVPEQAAIIGVDNDELVCNLCEPRLSSVIPDAFQTGYEAARILDAAMHSESPQPQRVLIPPRGAVTRQSTDIIAVEDETVARALKFIRQHASEGISVADVVQAMDLSRGTLDSRFRASIGRSVHAEIERIRIDHIKHLLAETSLSLEAIAHGAGFIHPEYMNVAFKRSTGISPGQYRLAKRNPRGAHE